MASDFLSQHISTQVTTRNISSTKSTSPRTQGQKSRRKFNTPSRKHNLKKPDKNRAGKGNKTKNNSKPGNYIPNYIWETLDQDNKVKFLEERDNTCTPN